MGFRLKQGDNRGDFVSKQGMHKGWWRELLFAKAANQESARLVDMTGHTFNGRSGHRVATGSSSELLLLQSGTLRWQAEMESGPSLTPRAHGFVDSGLGC